jgi:4'-phosphopantetheinyl transferase
MTVRLPPGLFLRELTFDASNQDRWLGLLSPEERRRLETFGHARRRHAFLAGRVAARTLLAERLALAPPEVPLHVAPDGAVEVGGTAFHVSIAHSGERAVAAVADRPIGADLEEIRPRHPDLARFVLHPDEADLLDRLPLEPGQGLILCWTLKEATLKAVRTGLRLSPKKLRLEIDLPAASAQVEVDGGAVWLARFEERDGYYVAVAYPAEDHPGVRAEDGWP